jgi:polysaccharide biosynthesis/export protein
MSMWRNGPSIAVLTNWLGVGDLRRKDRCGRSVGQGKAILMSESLIRRLLASTLLAMAACLAASGCHVLHHPPKDHHVETLSKYSNLPRELSKVTLPPYTIEPPDILIIEAIRVEPKEPPYISAGDQIALEVPRSIAPYQVNVFDSLNIQVQGALPEAPIAGVFQVQPNGTVNLGVPYGSVQLLGLTLEDAAQRLTEHLERELREPLVTLTLSELSNAPILSGIFEIQPDGSLLLPEPYGAVQIGGLPLPEAKNAIRGRLQRYWRDPEVIIRFSDIEARQQISGQHLVGPDGTVTLGSYGSVFVVGMTLEQAKLAIESHLTRFLKEPVVAVDVFAYNSKVYYVITQGAGLGDGVTVFPITGNETVLDAISRINGLTQVSSKRIWIARPVPGGYPPQILKVDWHGITAGALAETNYQILPGDRVFVAEDKLVALDTGIGKIISPVERLFGFTILGTQTVSGLRFFHRGGSGGFGGNGGFPTP